LFIQRHLKCAAGSRVTLYFCIAIGGNRDAAECLNIKSDAFRETRNSNDTYKANDRSIFANGIDFFPSKKTKHGGTTGPRGPVYARSTKD
jgi:hypothetical protein